MKLLYITPFIEGAGGVQRILAVKTDYLIEKFGHEIHILVTNSGFARPHYPFNDKVRFYHGQASGKSLGYLLDYSRIIKQHAALISPEVVLVCDNGFKGYAASLFLGKKYPVIFESHITKFITARAETFAGRIPNRMKYGFYDFCISRYDKCVVLVESSKEEFSGENVVVIPNPLWFVPNTQAGLEAEKAIAVGRHTYEKAFDRMLSIWKKITDKHPGWILEIYGDANPELDLAGLSEKIGVRDKVVFHDPVKDIRQKYTEASICLMTSRYEGFGMALIEAMACGVPCVAYDCPRGPSDIIASGENGFVIENGNETDFVTAVETLISDTALRKKMGEQAQSESRKYEISRIMETWNALLTEVAAIRK